MKTSDIVPSSQGPHKRDAISMTFGKRDQLRITAVTFGVAAEAISGSTETCSYVSKSEGFLL